MERFIAIRGRPFDPDPNVIEAETVRQARQSACAEDIVLTFAEARQLLERLEQKLAAEGACPICGGTEQLANDRACPRCERERGGGL